MPKVSKVEVINERYSTFPKLSLAKDRKTMASKEEKVLQIPLKDIVADLNWNSRSGDYLGDTSEETNSFKELIASIKDSGGINKDAAKVRPKGNTGKFSLVSGFRRYAAIKAIAEEQGNKDPVMRVIVEELDELAARQENVRENVARASLKGADLAWSLLELHQQFLAKKIEPTDIMITNSVGMNQSYGNKLLNIAKKVKPAIFKAWRESKLPLTVPEMLAVSKVDPARQQEEYDALMKKKAPKSGKDKTKIYLDSMKKKAAKLAYLLGTMEREGLINTDNFTFENHITYLVAFKKDATPKQVEAVAVAAEKAYNEAMAAEPNSEADEDDE
jgi:hypothetical protein